MEGGSIHTVTENEKGAYADHINTYLKDEIKVKHLMPVTSKNLFECTEDGILLCKMINMAVTRTIPDVSINVNVPLNIFQKTENLNLAIASAKEIGCKVVNIHPQSILEKKEHIVTGLVWQVIRIHIFSNINIKHVPELVLLKKEDEELDAIYKLKPEEMLLRWLNYHVALDGESRVIKNLGNDVADGVAYGHVFSHISDEFTQDYWTLSPEQRAARVLGYCKKLQIIPHIKAEDIVYGNSRLNTLFCAQIFNEHHGLKFKEEQKVLEIVETETDESREIKVFKNWINSMGLEDVFVNWLIDDLRDGRILLKVIDRLRPGLVNWTKANTKQDNRFTRVQNCNYVIELCKNELKLKIIAVGGIDIVDGKTTLVLGVVWQLCRLYWIERIGDISEEKLLEWGNGRVPEELRVKTFKEKDISNCMFLLKIIESIDNRVVDYSVLKKEDTTEARESNIKYTISAARKLGAEVMLLWNHIDEHNAKFIFTFVSELYHQAHLKKK